MAFFHHDDPTEELTQRNLKSPTSSVSLQSEIIQKLQRENLYLKNQLFNLIQVMLYPCRIQAPMICTYQKKLYFTSNFQKTIKVTHLQALGKNSQKYFIKRMNTTFCNTRLDQSATLQGFNPSIILISYTK